MAKRRANGEGTLYERTQTRSDGSTYTVWEAKVTVGYKANGKPNRKSLYGKTQKEALEKRNALMQALATGVYTEDSETVKQYVNRWLKHKVHEVKPQTVEDYKYQLEKYVLPQIGHVKLDKLRPMHIQNLCSTLANTVSPQRANKCRRVLSSALSQAVRWQIIPRNPCDAVKPMKVSKKDMTIWTAQDAAQFLDTAREHRLYALFYLAMSTGMRRGEVLGLKWDDISPTAVTVKRNVVDQRGKIIISTPKTRKGERRISIAPDVWQVMEGHRQAQHREALELGISWGNTGYVFVSTLGTFLHPRNVSRIWYVLQAKAEVTQVRFHDLRHLRASMLIKSGQDVRTVANELGHTNPSFTLDVYSHMFEEQHERQAVSLLDMLPSGKGEN